MDEQKNEYSGRIISQEDIKLIQWTAKVFPGLSRKELANTICESLEWKQINGKPKTAQCLKMLESLEVRGLVKLPELKIKKQTRKKQAIANPEDESSDDEKNNEPDIITECRKPYLIIPQGEEENKQWSKYVQKYHYLGYKTQYGAQIRYFIRSNDQDLGCIQFSASAWALGSRDAWIGWTAEQKKTHLFLVINNSRFLLFPWVRVKNLGSKSLSLAAHRIQKDWLNIYNYEPVLLETFVEVEKYSGTIYKAANWQKVGLTQGRGRNDRNKEYALTEKAIYLYPLQSDFREILKGEKPYKAVRSDE